MKYPPLPGVIAGIILLGCSLCNRAAEAEAGRVERALKIPGLHLLLQDGVDSVAAGGAEKGDPSSPDANAGAPQRADNGTQPDDRASIQPNPNLVYAPGTDSTRYVPGSSARGFNALDAFKLGRVILRPSARLTYGYDSNLFNYSRSGAFSDSAFVIEPAIEAFVPVTSNGIRLEYGVAYRRSPDYDLSHRLSHAFDADSLFDLSPILSLGIREHFALNSLNSNEYMPGREILFSDTQFKRNEVNAQLDWAITRNDHFGLNAGWNRISFDYAGGTVVSSGGQLVNEFPFYNYDEYRSGGKYTRDLSERISVFAEGNVLRLDTGDPRHVADSNGYESVAGVDATVTPLTSLEFAFGARGNNYPGLPGQSFRGFIYRGSLQKDVTETIKVTLSGSRTLYPSYFQNNPYMLSNGIGLTYLQELGPKVFISLRPGYQSSSYPLPLIAGQGIPPSLVGVKNRSDRILDFSIDARYSHSEWVSVDFLFSVLNRNSDIPDFRFTDYRAGVSLVFGLRGVGRGQIPY